MVTEVSRLMNTDELMSYTKLGRNNAVKWADSIGARVAIGRRVLWDRVKIDQNIDHITGAESSKNYPEGVPYKG